jgi:pyruvate ferredoxin oxidoreductase alpha subunit
MTKTVVEASHAIAIGAKLCKPDVIPMYPITPQTHVVEDLAEFINNGEMRCAMVDVESEHSAASAMLGVVAAGSRCFTATSSQGLALMFEILPIISGMRLPGVMAVANRALSAPISIWNDHSDAVSARDQGWIQLWVESSQEALDAVIQGFKISEDKSVQMPLMVCFDGFTLSHVFEPVDVPSQQKVNAFLPEFKASHVLNPKKPLTMGPIGFPNSFMKFKEQQQEAMANSIDVIKKANKEFATAFGRKYGSGLVDLYKMNDAEYAVMGMGTLCGTARVAVDKLRKQGKKVGLIRLRSLRPFPEKELQLAIKNLKALGIIDRHISLGQEGPLFTDVRSAVYCNDISINSYIAGLGGKDITVKHFEKVFSDLEKGKQKGEWLF